MKELEEVEESEKEAAGFGEESCFARNRASFGITKMMKQYQAVQCGGVNPLLRALSGQDARDAGKVLRDADVHPGGGGAHQRVYVLERIVPQLEDEQAARPQELTRLTNERRIDLEAGLAGDEGLGGFVLANVAREEMFFSAADVGWVADNQVKRCVIRL